ncbi:hypothetical protein ES703_11319 [subsurface metagenome]
MADHEDYEDVDPKPVEIYQPDPVERFKVIQAVAANLKATVTQLSIVRTVQQATEANLKAIVSVNDFQTLIDEVRLLRNSNLLVTGQTTLYHAGDDGDLEKGVIKSYTVLDAGDYSGTTDIVINAKTHALSNECVQDNNTGLMWTRYVPLDDIGPDSDGKLLWADAVNDEDIWEFVSVANAASLGGHDDWRVPNVTELISLFDLSTWNPALDSDVFPSTPILETWTSNTNDRIPDQAFTISFYYGYLTHFDKATAKGSCRLVRG